MKILILGGTKFVGRHITEAALDRGHDVTLFNRGKSGGDLFSQIRQLHGDRLTGIGLAAAESWDCVVDVSGYVTDQVRASATALQAMTQRYLFISTISVYPPRAMPVNADERSAIFDLSGPEAERGVDSYGAQKANCERVLAEVFDAAALTIVRPTIVAGPHDPTDRFTYWVRRLARGGRTVVPASQSQAVQVIDARDLAAFTMGLIENSVAGTFNAAGLERQLTMATMLEAIAGAVGQGFDPVPIGAEVLAAAGVSLPFELAAGAPDHMFRVSNVRGRGAGLSFRPLAETVADTLAWDHERGLPPLAVGPDQATELRLLAASPVA